MGGGFMNIPMKVEVVFLAFLAMGAVARADPLPCQWESGFDAAEQHECGTAGETTTAGPSTPGQALATKNCQQASTAGIANCKRVGGTAAQISACDAKVQTTLQQCVAKATADYGPGPDFGQAGDNTITGKNSDPFDSAGSAASAAVAAQASASFAAKHPSSPMPSK
jgi:hypothetical protein